MADSPQAALRTLWSHRWLVLAITAATGLAAAVYAWTATPRYLAEVVLMPTEESAEDQLLGSLGGLGGEVGGLASLAGISLGGSDSLEKKALAALKSRSLISTFVTERKLMPVLFAHKWDEERGAWKARLSPDEVPTADDAYALFDKKIRRVSVDQKTGIVRLGVLWKDRKQAAEWANALVSLVNSRMRQEQIAEARASRAYIASVLANVEVASVRQALYRMDESHLRREMLARVRDQFAYRIIDPAVVPDEDRFKSPARLLILLMGLMGGFVLGVIAVFLRLELRTRT